MSVRQLSVIADQLSFKPSLKLLLDRNDVSPLLSDFTVLLFGIGPTKRCAYWADRHRLYAENCTIQPVTPTEHRTVKLVHPQ